ncbi:glycoside hydrolase N-terminal domain-containing protein [Streptomyces sp. NPDC056361]|uniref:glycosyl hydrolase family 95 catalytic domain-containing protein n=1 Tax=Streptomyces sp. NPDC056361 TaxID=3345795 RepID=UPI0035DADC3A
MIHGTWEPGPAARWEDAFLAGNGRHGALVDGDPEDDRVTVTHHTLVRPNNAPADTAPPRLAARLPALQDALLAGDATAAESFTDGRPLCWVQPFHPGFATRLRRTPAAGPLPVRRSVDFATGVVTGVCGERRSEVFVSRADDVVVQYVTAPGPSVEIDLDHRLPGAPAGLGIGRGVATARGECVLTLCARYPDSPLGYTGLTLLVTDTGRTTLTASGVRIEGAGRLLLLTRVRRHAGDFDRDGETEALRSLAAGAGTGTGTRAGSGSGSGSGTAGAVGEGAGRATRFRAGAGTTDPAAVHAWLLARHTALHEPAYRRVTLDLGADATERALPGSALLARPESPALLERLFAAGRYHLLSSSGMLPPRLPGLWTGDWNTAWSGAFTTNANLNLQTASAVAAARHALRAADRAPAADAARWRALADRLPPYRVDDDGALAEWARPGLGDHYRHRHLSHLHPVWPLDEINPYDTPGLARAAHRALEMRRSENDSAHGHLHHGLVAARLADSARAGDALRHVLTGDYFHDSLMSAHHPARDVYNADAAHALPALLIECLVQSTPRRLVLLPAPPDLCPRGHVAGVRTRFGARLDLTWSPGAYRAVLRPDRDADIEVRSPAGASRLVLRRGEESVVGG